MAFGTPLAGTIVSNASTDLLATGIVLTPHASTNEGDLMVAFIGNISNFNHVWQAVAGWTLVFTQVDGAGTNKQTAVYHKFAGASEGSSTFKTATDSDSPPNHGVIITFPGGDASTALDVAYSEPSHHTADTNTPTTNDIAHNAITTVTDGSYVILYCHSNGDATMTATAVPTGYTELSSSLTDATRTFIIAGKIVTTAGTETPGVAGFTSDAGTGDYSFYTLALKGAPAAGGNSPTGNLRGALFGCLAGVI